MRKYSYYKDVTWYVSRICSSARPLRSECFTIEIGESQYAPNFSELFFSVCKSRPIKIGLPRKWKDHEAWSWNIDGIKFADYFAAARLTERYHLLVQIFRHHSGISSFRSAAFDASFFRRAFHPARTREGGRERERERETCGKKESGCECGPLAL